MPLWWNQGVGRNFDIVFQERAQMTQPGWDHGCLEAGLLGDVKYLVQVRGALFGDEGSERVREVTDAD